MLWWVSTNKWTYGKHVMFADPVVCMFLTFVPSSWSDKDPSRFAELPPAAFLGEEVPPGKNQTHNPASVSVWGEGQAHVRRAVDGLVKHNIRCLSYQCLKNVKIKPLNVKYCRSCEAHIFECCELALWWCFILLLCSPSTQWDSSATLYLHSLLQGEPAWQIDGQQLWCCFPVDVLALKQHLCPKLLLKHIFSLEDLLWQFASFRQCRRRRRPCCLNPSRAPSPLCSTWLSGTSRWTETLQTEI